MSRKDGNASATAGRFAGAFHAFSDDDGARTLASGPASQHPEWQAGMKDLCPPMASRLINRKRELLQAGS